MITLPKGAYRALQSRLLGFHRFWVPSINLRKAIHDLRADVLLGASHIKRHVLPSNDTLLVAHYFIATQRRLQRKVVSDDNYMTGFMVEGHSGTLMQNRPTIPTQFEITLSRFAGQTGVPIAGAVLPQIDQCCLLMERYVAIHSNSKDDRSNLSFQKGVHGGSGRGPVDDYNMLCDILSKLRQAGKEQGKEVPGMVRKFLAKDIMAWNNAFADDALGGDCCPSGSRGLLCGGGGGPVE